MDTRTRLSIKEVIRRRMSQKDFAELLGVSRENLNTTLNTPSDWPYRWQEIINALEGVEIVVMDRGEVVEPDPIDLAKVERKMSRKRKKKDIE